jgi:hypothetical protein
MQGMPDGLALCIPAVSEGRGTLGLRVRGAQRGRKGACDRAKAAAWLWLRSAVFGGRFALEILTDDAGYLLARAELARLGEVWVNLLSFNSPGPAEEKDVLRRLFPGDLTSSDATGRAALNHH